MSRNLAEQLDRAADSVILNIAEGCGRSSVKEQSRHFTIARGSMREGAGALDALHVKGQCAADDHAEGKQLAKRVIEMLTKMSA